MTDSNPYASPQVESAQPKPADPRNAQGKRHAGLGTLLLFAVGGGLAGFLDGPIWRADNESLIPAVLGIFVGLIIGIVWIMIDAIVRKG